MKITFLGTGTSTGVPVLGCRCSTCTSADPRDRRLRPSILVEMAQRRVLVDITPDFRYQMLRAGQMRVDAVLVTHEHADHVHGIDDVRPLNYLQDGAIPLYATSDVLHGLTSRFAYCFQQYPRPGCPALEPVAIAWGRQFDLFGRPVLPLPAEHQRVPVTVYRFGNWAYCTDVKRFPESTLQQLQGLDLLILNALRPRPHVAHLSIGEALDVVQRLAPRRTLFTHITHDVLHARDLGLLPDGVEFAVDGLVVEV